MVKMRLSTAPEASSKLKFVAILIRALTTSSSSSLQTPTHHVVDTASNAIDRIALRFRNLGLTSVHHTDHDVFLRREWIHPDRPLFQWDKQKPQQQELEAHEKEKLKKKNKEKKKKKKKNVNVAEPTLEKEDLRRLLNIGMRLKEKVTIPKAGLTRPVLDKIHNQWKHCELVRLKFHEHLAHNMNLALQIVQHCAAEN